MSEPRRNYVEVVKRYPTADNTIRELPGLPVRATRAIAELIR